MPLAALRAHTLASLFDVTSAQLIDRMRASTEPHVSLNLGNGAVVCARVQFRRASRAEGSRPAEVHDGGTAQAARPTAAQNAASLSRLSYLDTGDPQVAAVIAKVRKVIGKDIPVLITGETGTGKELLAQAIHNDSPRRDGPFVAVNCASIPETLIESELFGYEEGAFTGARRKGATGKLLQANGGTLFLDEIGDMPYPLQVRLLRVLQERIVNPLGSTKAIGVDIAIICATHRDLRDDRAEPLPRRPVLPAQRPGRAPAAAARSHRPRGGRAEDAAAGDAVGPRPPPVERRARRDGAVRALRLAGQLPAARQPAAHRRRDGRRRRRNSPRAFAGRFLRRRAARADTGRQRPRRGVARGGARAAGRRGGAAAASDARLQDVAASAIAAALARHGGNVSAAARALGVSRNTIYRKMPAAAQDATEPETR
jgi:transcriptional regulator of acetoin/glycerol metabolism